MGQLAKSHFSTLRNIKDEWDDTWTSEGYEFCYDEKIRILLNNIIIEIAEIPVFASEFNYIEDVSYEDNYHAWAYKGMTDDIYSSKWPSDYDLCFIQKIKQLFPTINTMEQYDVNYIDFIVSRVDDYLSTVSIIKKHNKDRIANYSDWLNLMYWAKSDDSLRLFDAIIAYINTKLADIKPTQTILVDELIRALSTSVSEKKCEIQEKINQLYQLLDHKIIGLFIYTIELATKENFNTVYQIYLTQKQVAKDPYWRYHLSVEPSGSIAWITQLLINTAIPIELKIQIIKFIFDKQNPDLIDSIIQQLYKNKILLKLFLIKEFELVKYICSYSTEKNYYQTIFEKYALNSDECQTIFFKLLDEKEVSIIDYGFGNHLSKKLNHVHEKFLFQYLLAKIQSANIGTVAYALKLYNNYFSDCSSKIWDEDSKKLSEKVKSNLNKRITHDKSSIVTLIHNFFTMTTAEPEYVCDSNNINKYKDNIINQQNQTVTETIDPNYDCSFPEENQFLTDFNEDILNKYEVIIASNPLICFNHEITSKNNFNWVLKIICSDKYDLKLKQRLINILCNQQDDIVYKSMANFLLAYNQMIFDKISDAHNAIQYWCQKLFGTSSQDLYNQVIKQYLLYAITYSTVAKINQIALIIYQDPISVELYFNRSNGCWLDEVKQAFKSSLRKSTKDIDLVYIILTPLIVSAISNYFQYTNPKNNNLYDTKLSDFNNRKFILTGELDPKDHDFFSTKYILQSDRYLSLCANLPKKKIDYPEIIACIPKDMNQCEVIADDQNYNLCHSVVSLYTPSAPPAEVLQAEVLQPEVYDSNGMQI